MKNIKKALGYLIMVLLFIGWFIGLALTNSISEALTFLGVVVLIAAIVLLAVYLINSDSKF